MIRSFLAAGWAGLFLFSLIQNIIPVYSEGLNIPPDSNTYYAYVLNVEKLAEEITVAELVDTVNAEWTSMSGDRGLYAETVFDQIEHVSPTKIYLYTNNPSGALFRFDYIPVIDFTLQLFSEIHYSDGTSAYATDARTVLALTHADTRQTNLLLVRLRVAMYQSSSTTWEVYYYLNLTHYRYDGMNWEIVDNKYSSIIVHQDNDPWNARVRIVLVPEFQIYKDNYVKLVFWLMTRYYTSQENSYAEVNSIFETYNLTSKLISYQHDFNKLIEDLTRNMTYNWYLWLGLGYDSYAPEWGIGFKDYGAGAPPNADEINMRAFFSQIMLQDIKYNITKLGELAITHKLRSYSPITYAEMNVTTSLDSLLGISIGQLIILGLASGLALAVMIMFKSKWGILLAFGAYLFIITYFTKDFRVLIAGGVVYAYLFTR